MAANVLSRFFSSRNERVVRRMRQKVASINALEPRYAALTDDELRHQTAVFRERLGRGEPLDALLPEAFAVVR